MRNTSRFKEALIATGPLNGRWTIYDRALAGPQKHTTSPNILAILGNHPGASPQPRSNSHPITASSVIGFLSGIIFLVLAIFVSCLWLTWIWQPFGFYTLYFGTLHGLELFLLLGLQNPALLPAEVTQSMTFSTATPPRTGMIFGRKDWKDS